MGSSCSDSGTGVHYSLGPHTITFQSPKIEVCTLPRDLPPLEFTHKSTLSLSLILLNLVPTQGRNPNSKHSPSSKRKKSYESCVRRDRRRKKNRLMWHWGHGRLNPSGFQSSQEEERTQQIPVSFQGFDPQLPFSIHGEYCGAFLRGIVSQKNEVRLSYARIWL